MLTGLSPDEGLATFLHDHLRGRYQVYREHDRNSLTTSVTRAWNRSRDRHHRHVPRWKSLQPSPVRILRTTPSCNDFEAAMDVRSSAADANRKKRRRRNKTICAQVVSGCKLSYFLFLLSSAKEHFATRALRTFNAYAYFRIFDSAMNWRVRSKYNLTPHQKLVQKNINWFWVVLVYFSTPYWTTCYIMDQHHFYGLNALLALRNMDRD